MKNKNRLTLNDIPENTKIAVSKSGSVEKAIYREINGSEITVLSVGNGVLSFTILPERGMDIGEIYFGDEKISWDRDTKYLLHPENVNLTDNDGTGWVKGFYPVVASIG